MTRREIGNTGEDFTAEALRKNGFEIIERNFRIRGGEIDIIAKKGSILHFVEVKTRKSGALTTGDDAVNARKRELLIRAAKEYLKRTETDCSCVFDAAIVTASGSKITGFRYIPRAFTA